MNFWDTEVGEKVGWAIHEQNSLIGTIINSDNEEFIKKRIKSAQKAMDNLYEYLKNNYKT